MLTFGVVNSFDPKPVNPRHAGLIMVDAKQDDVSTGDRLDVEWTSRGLGSHTFSPSLGSMAEIFAAYLA
jgi:hypothetical protein